jgi:hypothetical protein
MHLRTRCSLIRPCIPQGTMPTCISSEFGLRKASAARKALLACAAPALLARKRRSLFTPTRRMFRQCVSVYEHPIAWIRVRGSPHHKDKPPFFAAPDTYQARFHSHPHIFSSSSGRVCVGVCVLGCAASRVLSYASSCSWKPMFGSARTHTYTQTRVNMFQYTIHRVLVSYMHTNTHECVYTHLRWAVCSSRE